MSGFSAFMLGFFLLISPNVREDHRQLSTGEIVSGIVAIFVSLVIWGLGIFASRGK
jgi:hypothetical protein